MGIEIQRVEKSELCVCAHVLVCVCMYMCGVLDTGGLGSSQNYKNREFCKYFPLAK